MRCQLAVDEEAQVDDFTAAGAPFRLRQPGSQLWLKQQFHGLDIQQIQLLTFHCFQEAKKRIKAGGWKRKIKRLTAH